MKPSSKIVPRPNGTPGSGTRPRKHTEAELQAHRERVVALGCIACRKLGYHTPGVELHHARAEMGMGQRADDFSAIGLCPAHHRGTMGSMVPSIHLEPRAFTELFGTELALLDEVRRLLG